MSVHSIRFDRLALGTAFATVALMTLGSVVHGTGSSLACPDWPLCHGRVFPAMTGGVEFEHSHRLVAGAVAALTVALTVASWRRADRSERLLALAACGLIALQAGLGALTVLLRLPPAVSVAHLATSMAFLGVLVALSARWGLVAPSLADSSSRAWLTAGILAVYLQVVLGAVVRHRGAALVCTEWLSCTGALWPVDFPQAVHMAHRTMALVVAIVVMASTIMRYRKGPPVGNQRVIVLAPAALVLCQIGLGVAVVATNAPLAVVTVHHAMAALLLASLVLASARSRRAGVFS
jgi:heme A synthase